MIIVGTPEQCLEKIIRYDEAGVDQLLCYVQFGDLPHEKVMRSLELLGTEVIPVLEREGVGGVGECERVVTRTDDSPVPDYASLLRLDGRRFVVLGAGQGIGRQAAHTLASVARGWPASTRRVTAPPTSPRRSTAWRSSATRSPAPTWSGCSPKPGAGSVASTVSSTSSAWRAGPSCST